MLVLQDDLRSTANNSNTALWPHALHHYYITCDVALMIQLTVRVQADNPWWKRAGKTFNQLLVSILYK